METTPYNLKSRPFTTDVPAEYVHEATELVRVAVENPARLIYTSSDYPCLRDPDILRNTADLAATHSDMPESLRLQDLVFLRVCLYANEQYNEINGGDIDLFLLIHDLETTINLTQFTI